MSNRAWLIRLFSVLVCMHMLFSSICLAEENCADAEDAIVSQWIRQAENGDIWAILDLCSHYTTLGEWEKARDYIHTALENGYNVFHNIASFYMLPENPYADVNKALEFARMGIASGDMASCCVLGIMYEEGVFGVPDHVAAAKLYRQAADAGVEYAYFCMGLVYTKERYGIMDYEQAVRWYEKAAAAGNASAMVNLSNLYTLEKYGMVDLEKELEWAVKAEQAGKESIKAELDAIPDGTFAAGCRDYFREEYAKAAASMEKAALDGDGRAMRYLGRMYLEGDLGDPDNQAAIAWYLKAVEAGDSVAPYSLGMMYWFPEFGMYDLEKAENWFLKAVEEEYAPAYTAMAMLQEEKGSTDAANEWYIMAAERGETTAMHNLGYNALVQSDLDAAIQWFSMAGEAGKAESAHNLGCIYWDMLADWEAAEQAFLQGAQLNYLPSMNSLGVIMVETGQVEEGLRWITRAAERGQESAKNNLVYIYSHPEYGVYQLEAAEYWRKQLLYYMNCDEILI